MSTHPEILWAQRSSELDDEKNILYLTINLTEINKSTLELDIQPKELTFKAKAGRPEEHDYTFSFALFDEIVPEKSSKHLTTRSLSLVLRKKEKKLEFWPRLTEVKKLPYVKTDFSKWVDEDEQDGDAAKIDDDGFEGMGGMEGMGMPGMGGMGGAGGMGGMGGLGGMGAGGMGGLGGMGAGGMDLEKMMAELKANKTEGIEHADSDSDDDAPPPLEDAEPEASSSS